MIYALIRAVLSKYLSFVMKVLINLELPPKIFAYAQNFSEIVATAL